MHKFILAHADGTQNCGAVYLWMAFSKLGKPQEERKRAAKSAFQRERMMLTEGKSLDIALAGELAPPFQANQIRLDIRFRVTNNNDLMLSKEDIKLYLISLGGRCQFTSERDSTRGRGTDYMIA